MFRKSFVLIFITGFFAMASVPSPDWRKLTYVMGCSLYSFEGKIIKSFPGVTCLFLDDGRVISGGGNNGLRMIAPDQKILWSLDGKFHHGMSLTNDKKFILAMDSIPSKKNSGIRMDRFLKVDLEGKVHAEQTAENVFKIKNLPVRFTKVPDKIESFTQEGSHFNSIYEISDNAKSGVAGYLAAGNVIINSNGYGIFILSADFKNVLGHWNFIKSKKNMLHDVQVTEEGDFIYFHNHNDDDPAGAYSSIDIWDPIQKTLKFKYTAQPKQFFFSPIRGSVQLLDRNTILFSDHLKGAFVIKKNEKELVGASSDINIDPVRAGVALPTQEIKARDLKKFLSHWVP